MQLTIVVPDEIGRRVQQLSNPDQFIAEILTRALPKAPPGEKEPVAKPSRWARLAQRVSEDPVHLDGYSRDLEKDAREFREDFAFRHDRES